MDAGVGALRSRQVAFRLRCCSVLLFSAPMLFENGSVLDAAADGSCMPVSCINGVWSGLRMYCLVYRSWVVRERKDSATCCGLGDGRCKGLIVHGHLEPYSPATDPERASLAIRQQVLICQTPPIQSRPHRSPCSRRAGSPRPCPILAWMLLPLIRRLRGNAPRT